MSRTIGILFLFLSFLSQAWGYPTRMHDGHIIETYNPLVTRHPSYKNAVYFTNWCVGDSLHELRNQAALVDIQF
jgi:hypothetical protein